MFKYRVFQKKCNIAIFSLNLFQRSDYTFSRCFGIRILNPFHPKTLVPKKVPLWVSKIFGSTKKYRYRYRLTFWVPSNTGMYNGNFVTMVILVSVVIQVNLVILFNIAILVILVNLMILVILVVLVSLVKLVFLLFLLKLVNLVV